ncbi:MAG: ATP-dependent Clp protease proteolytic subunit [Pseudomonadota bacterium]
MTNRPLIVYAANTLKKGSFNIANTIDDSDITGFSDLIENIDEKHLDIFLHSPGGTAEAAERIVNLLRANFGHIRFLIPNAAHSAATMLALCGDEILMDERSTLGPIDPQIILMTPQGIMSVPVHDILEGFEKIRKVLKDDPESLSVYLPMLNKYDLHIFEICKNAQELAKELAKTWLTEYMIKPSEDRDEKVENIVIWLSDHSKHLSHGRMINIQKCIEYKLNVKNLRDTPELREELWKLYCLIELLFDRSSTVKLFENSRGVSWARSFSEQIVQIPFPTRPPQPPQSPGFAFCRP